MYDFLTHVSVALLEALTWAIIPSLNLTSSFNPALWRCLSFDYGNVERLKCQVLQQKKGAEPEDAGISKFLHFGDNSQSQPHKSHVAKSGDSEWSQSSSMFFLVEKVALLMCWHLDYLWKIHGHNGLHSLLGEQGERWVFLGPLVTNSVSDGVSGDFQHLHLSSHNFHDWNILKIEQPKYHQHVYVPEMELRNIYVFSGLCKRIPDPRPWQTAL